MTVRADYEAIRTLIIMCREGTFYDDYDESTRVLGDAENALNRLAQPPTADRRPGPSAVQDDYYREHP